MVCGIHSAMQKSMWCL
uniref:Uncharacterized protein n=1 Tax=Anguilla anguilla TaxID=7936 RepID=A0A0E9PB77_ANGAN